MSSIGQSPLAVPILAKTWPRVAEKEDLVHTYDCLDFHAPNRMTRPMTPRRRSVWDKPLKQDRDEKAVCMAAFMKNTESAAKSFFPKSSSQRVQSVERRVFSPDPDDCSSTGELQKLYLDSVALIDSNKKGGRKGSISVSNDISRGMSKEGTRTPTESMGSGTASSKGTSTCASRLASPPPEPMTGLIADVATDIMIPVPDAVSRRYSSKYSTMEECASDKIEIKRIIRKIAEKAEFKLRDIRDMFIAVDSDNNGKLSHSETVQFFANFELESELADKFFTLVENRSKVQTVGSDEIELARIYGRICASARDRHVSFHTSSWDLPQRYKTWRPVPGATPGFQTMLLA